MKKKPTKPLDQYVPHNRFVRDAASEACLPNFLGMNCLLCGSTWKTAGHHIIRRGQSNHFLHDICNVVPLCGKCHCSVTNRTGTEILLQEHIRQNTPLWHEYILWAIDENRRRVKADIKPDYYKALCWWRDHEDSGRTIDESRTAALDAWDGNSRQRAEAKRE